MSDFRGDYSTLSAAGRARVLSNIMTAVLTVVQPEDLPEALSDAAVFAMQQRIDRVQLYRAP